MKRILAFVVVSLALQAARADGTKFRYTLDESAAEPVWVGSDSYKACVDALIDPDKKYVRSGAGHMVIEVLQDVSVDHTDIGLNHADTYFSFHEGDKYDLTIRSGGGTRHTFTYTGTKEIKTWMEPTIIFSNIVLTATGLKASETFFCDWASGGRGTSLMKDAEIANCTCRAVQLQADKPFRMYPGSSIHGNTTTGNGAGVRIDGSSELVLCGGTIYGNTASLGGGVYLSQPGKIIFSDSASSISGNTSTGDATGANVYATAAALPFFRADVAGVDQVLDYFSPAQLVDGLVFCTYTCAYPDILSHFVCKITMPAGASVVAQDGEVRVSSTVSAPVRYSTDNGVTWTLGTDLRAAIDVMKTDGKSIIELLEDTTYSAATLFSDHSFILRTKPGLPRRTVTLQKDGFFWINKVNVVLTNVIVTAVSGYVSPRGTAFGIQGNPSTLTFQDGTEIRDIPQAAVAEFASANAGSKFTLCAGAKIVRCGVATENGGAFIRNEKTGNLAFELRGGEIASCVGRYGGVYLTDGSTMEVYADSIVTGCVNSSSVAANVYQCRPGAVTIASSAVSGANKVRIATPEGNDGELVASLAAGLESYPVPATALRSDDNADAVVVRDGDSLYWSTTRAHRDFRYSYDGILFFETDSFKTAYASQKVNNVPLTIELMRNASMLNDDSTEVGSGWVYINRPITLRSHGTARYTLTRTGGLNSIFFWSQAGNSMVSNIILTADETFTGTQLLQAGGNQFYFGEGCEIRPPQNVQAVFLGAGGVGPVFTMLPGSKIVGAQYEVEGAAVKIDRGTLDLRGGEISGNVGLSAVYVAGDQTQVRVSGAAKITGNETSLGKASNLKFSGANGLFVQTGDLTAEADVNLSRNNFNGGVFGVSSNVTDGCYQTWEGSKYIHSDVKKSLDGSTAPAAGGVVNLVWKKVQKGLAIILR